MADASDAPASSGVMIAFLPTSSEWCQLDLPHMTLVYAGTTDDRSPADFNTLAKDAATIAMLYHPFALSVTGVEVFGDEEKVDVLRFRMTPELVAARRIVQQWNASEHPFRPHATMGPTRVLASDAREFLPQVVGFDRIMVSWGEESITFKL